VAYDSDPTKGNGGIALGVVDPAAPRPNGLYEDNNPWPVPNTDTPETALVALDRGLGVQAGVGYGAYAIRRVETGDRAVPSMKLTTSDTSDYTAGDGANNGMTFANMGYLKNPLTITITGPSTGAQPVLALSELGSMFALDVPVTMTIDNVTLRGLSAGHVGDPDAGGTGILISPATVPIDIPASTPAQDNNTALVYVGKGSTFEMLGSAELTGNYNASVTTAAGGNGGAARVVGGIFRMTGDDSSVHHNYAGHYGGGVWSIGEGGTPAQIIMAGENAEVSFNAVGNGSTVGAGGGILADGDTNPANASHFVMSGNNAKVRGNQGRNGGGTQLYGTGSTGLMSGTNAEISGNTSVNGVGGVYVAGNSQFTMSGASAHISGNTADTYAGGVYVTGNSQFTMSGASAHISGNTAGGSGGGVYLDSGAQFTMSGMNAQISDNKSATNSGGVCMSNSQFTMSGSASAISGNIANGDGGGVNVRGGGTFIMEGGEIFGNKATSRPGYTGVGGGIGTEGGTAIMTGGTIYGFEGKNAAGIVDRPGNLADQGEFDSHGGASAAVYWGISMPNGGTVGSTVIPPGAGSTSGWTSETVHAPYDAANNIAVTAITLNTASITLQPPGSATGTTATLTATISPANATYPALSWTSSDPGVSVTGSGTTVTVTALTAGATATITATASGKTATCAVSVLSTVGGPLPPFGE
jgi:uncharacterized protein YjdB